LGIPGVPSTRKNRRKRRKKKKASGQYVELDEIGKIKGVSRAQELLARGELSDILTTFRI